MRRRKALIIEYKKEECPVCKCEEFIKIGAHCFQGSARLIIGGESGSMLLACTKCGCVYLSKADLERSENEK